MHPGGVCSAQRQVRAFAQVQKCTEPGEIQQVTATSPGKELACCRIEYREHRRLFRGGREFGVEVQVYPGVGDKQAEGSPDTRQPLFAEIGFCDQRPITKRCFGARGSC